MHDLCLRKHLPSFKSVRSIRRPSAGRFRPLVESIESRVLLSTFTVSNLGDSGAGSLRQAILGANAGSGSETIDFSVAGTIALTSGALPTITQNVAIDGTSAPGFAGRPVVEVSAGGFGGLIFGAGSAGSALESIGIGGAAGSGVTLDDSHITVAGNDIGVALDGTTPMGNTGDGLTIAATSNNDVIGQTTTFVSGVSSDAISQASNVISSNGGNGITIDGSTGDVVVANYIGTDVSGTIALGNAGNGIEVESGASGNTIGGTITFNNTSSLVPDTNVISGNRGDGVLFTSGASNNFAGSNYIGVNVTGNAPLGNTLDGVAITDGAASDQLIGTYINLPPFVFANVISGNGGDGIRINDSNNDTVQANILGIGINNMTPIGNALDGILIEGTSANTQFGGVIPLGNVAAANGRNGVEISDSASGTVVFNTFGGEAAFEPYTNLGNGGDGVLVTSTGTGNIIRTNVLSNNRANGLELAGNATGVQVTEDIIGMNTSGMTPMPNGGNGIAIDGTAHGNSIGGFQQSIIPQNVISGNVGNGIAITGSAYDNVVFNSFIGVDVTAKTTAPNGGAGVYIGGGAYANTIGGSAAGYRDVISGNLGNGVELAGGTTGNVITGDLIGTDDTGTVPMPNGGNGIYIQDGSRNVVGGSAASSGNVIAFNHGAGVFIASGTGDAILGNSIFQNQGTGIVLEAGANNSQPAPRLSLVKHRRSAVIFGRLQGAPGSTYQVEFFATSRANASNPAQGQTYLGSITATTNNRGLARFRFLPPPQPRFTVFTATATSAASDSSSFSPGVPAERSPGSPRSVALSRKGSQSPWHARALHPHGPSTLVWSIETARHQRR